MLVFFLFMRNIKQKPKGRDSKQYISEGLQQRTELGLELSVVFVLMEKELIEKEESRVIGKACTWLNRDYNPRESIRAIQRQIGLIVEDSQREWSYEEMKKHLFYYYIGQIATKKIEEALANKKGNLSSYCRTVRSQGILEQHSTKIRTKNSLLKLQEQGHIEIYEDLAMESIVNDLKLANNYFIKPTGKEEEWGFLRCFTMIFKRLLQ